jgi:hypothetical protein
MRIYKSGTNWCFWRWTIQVEYIKRLHIVKTPWFAICLHWLLKEDKEPHLHDHPVSFLSCILRGGYWERRVDGHYRRSWWNWIRSIDRHRIVAALPGTLTLCFMGPKVQDWGFYVGSPVQKVYWRDYYK